MLKKQIADLSKEDYEKCLKLSEKILSDLKSEYPAISNLFSKVKVLDFLKVDNKMLQPYRINYIKKENYTSLINKLWNFNKKSFVRWLENWYKKKYKFPCNMGK